MEIDECSNEETDLFDLYEAIHVPLPKGRFSDNTDSDPHEERRPSTPVEAVDAQPFRRWLSTLRRRHVQRRYALRVDVVFHGLHNDNEIRFHDCRQHKYRPTF
jgi:hypothetical protein